MKLYPLSAIEHTVARRFLVLLHVPLIFFEGVANTILGFADTVRLFVVGVFNHVVNAVFDVYNAAKFLVMNLYQEALKAVVGFWTHIVSKADQQLRALSDAWHGVLVLTAAQKVETLNPPTIVPVSEAPKAQ